MLKATYMRRATTLSKTLLTAGLLGATALGAGSAQAATGCGVEISWSAWISGQSLTCGDKEFTWKSTVVPGNLASSVVSAAQPLPGDYLFNLDNEFATTDFDFTYEATITQPGWVFSKVDLDTDADVFANPASELEATYSFAGGNSPIVLKSINGSSSLETVTGGPTAITVRNIYNGEGAIDTIENSFQQTQTVPGPVPLLGAGAAFGFSRKLRRRLKGATLAQG
jgi:hypothetical protein